MFKTWSHLAFPSRVSWMQHYPPGVLNPKPEPQVSKLNDSLSLPPHLPPSQVFTLCSSPSVICPSIIILIFFSLLLFFLQREDYLYILSEITQFFQKETLETAGKPRKGGEESMCVCERESTFQISSINHVPESNVTNILQLEETWWSWGPSISLTPHDHRFIRAEERGRGRP